MDAYSAGMRDGHKVDLNAGSLNDNNEEHWNEVASKMLVGRRVASVKYMSEKEAKN